MEKNNKKLILIYLSIIIFLILGIVIYLEVKERRKVYTYATYKEIEVYDKKTLKDIKPSNLNIIENKKIDTTKIGKHKVKFKYKLPDKRRKYNGELTYKVVDKIKPLVSISNTYYTYVGNDFNVDDHAFYGDNYTRELKRNTIGYYDINKIGSYKLSYEVKDESNNKVVLPFTLKVIEKPKETSKPAKPRRQKGIKYEKLLDKVNEENGSIMIDVSKWQGEIDWAKVKESGIDYAMIRIGTQKAIGEDSRLDNYFKRNIEEAQKNNIKVGVYYFSYATTKQEAINQAKWVNNNLKGYKLDLPVAFDWESFQYFKIMKINFHDLNEIAKTFIKEIEKENNQAILYSSKSKLETIWDKDYRVWLAHYTNKTSYEGNKEMWQFTNIGNVPGIKGFVDTNVIYK